MTIIASIISGLVGGIVAHAITGAGTSRTLRRVEGVLVELEREAAGDRTAPRPGPYLDGRADGMDHAAARVRRVLP